MATILDSVIGLCIKKLQEIISEEAALMLGAYEELTELQRRMTQIQYFLSDAERRSIEELAVNNWLCELKDVVYDADDIIDLAKYKGRKLLMDRPSSSLAPRNPTRCSGLSLLSCFRNIQTRHEIGIQIRNLNTKLDKISRDKAFLTLENVKPDGNPSIKNQRKTSHLVEPNLVGKEIKAATARLVELILENKENKAYKLAIVGTGGVGKTTLAQNIYNHQRIKGNFSKHAWICVSQEYSEITLMKEVLRNIGVHEQQGETIGELKSKLASSIEKESFFAVLDDVWQSDVWTNLLRTPLYAAAQGVVLVTTRDDIVARRIGAEHMHRVELMSIDVGWELLWKSMNIKEEKEVQNLQEIGIEIVHKCGRLPLAIKVIASVLASKEKTEKQWRKILSNNAWSTSKLPPELGGALYLSYSELPPNLKQCFQHLALYPEDCEIYRDNLVRLWIAEGFIEEQQDQLLEDTAEEYYYELIDRNLLQPSPRYFTHAVCKMHDLLRQLACHLSREECFIGDPQSLDAMSKIRRVLVDTKETVVFPNLDKVQCRVRTLMFNDGNSTRIDSTIFMRFPRLRVLDLTNTDLHSIPDCISQLIHLRLLDVDGTNISYLPESISTLTNLQTLNLNGCHALYSLPVAITQLCNLRHLSLNNTPINQVPKGIGTLVFLNDIEEFPAGHGYGNTKLQDGWNLEELQPLLQLRQLRMIKLERVVPCGTTSLLIDKHHLQVLILSCTERADERYSEEDISKIENTFEELVPPHSLETIFIIGFFGRTYPTWICTCLSSLKHLNLINCIYCVHLPPIGQLPNLEYLRIEGASATTKIGPELLGDGVVYPGSKEAIAFPKLTWLIILNMHNWEGWSLVLAEQEESKEGKEDEGSAAKQKGGAQPHPTQFFPHLKKLDLSCCPKLRALPPQLAQVTSLNRIQIGHASCLKVVENLPFISDTLAIKGCGLLERVSNLPRVRQLGVHDCPNLRGVEKLSNLRELWLSKDMQEMSPLWVSELHQQCQQHHGEDLDVYTWREEIPN